MPPAGQQTPVLSVDKKSVYEGDTVKITCDAGDEGGELTFIFKEGSREIHRQTDDTGKVQWNHSLTSVGMADLSCLYLINTGSEILKSNLSNTVSVIVKGEQINHLFITWFILMGLMVSIIFCNTL